MNIRQLTRAFNLLGSGRVIEAHDITVGLANTSYLLVIDDGTRYVLRQLRVQTPESARVDFKLQALLTEEGVVAPRYLPLKNDDVVGQIDEYSFTISALIAGKHSDIPTIGLARSSSATLARIHNALKDVRDVIAPNPAQWLHLDNARQEIARCPEDLRLRLTARMDVAQAILQSDLPESVIHGDLILENTFNADDELKVVFDMETVEYTVRLLDIARTYVSFAFDEQLNRDTLRTNLFEGYDEAARYKLTDQEIELFPMAVEYVAIACAAWLHNNNGTEFVEPYLAVSPTTLN